MTKRIHYRAAIALVNAKLGTMVKGTYDKETSTIEVEYQEGPEAANVIHNAFSHKLATVKPEVKAAEVKKEEETEMSAMFTAEQVAALVLAASKGVVAPATQVVTKEVVPADYESLKKTAATWQSKYIELEKKYNSLVEEMKSAKPVEKIGTLVEAINEPMAEENMPEKKDDDEDDIFDEEFFAQYAVKTPEKKVTLTHEQRREEARAFMKQLLPENNMAWRIDLGGDTIVDSRDNNGLFFPHFINAFFKVVDRNDPHSEILYKKSNFSQEFEHYELNAEELEDKFHDAKCSDGSYMWDMQTLAFGFVFAKSAFRKYKVEDRF